MVWLQMHAGKKKRKEQGFGRRAVGPANLRSTRLVPESCRHMSIHNYSSTCWRVGHEFLSQVLTRRQLTNICGHLILANLTRTLGGKTHGQIEPQLKRRYATTSTLPRWERINHRGMRGNNCREVLVSEVKWMKDLH